MYSTFIQFHIFQAFTHLPTVFIGIFNLQSLVVNIYLLAWLVAIAPVAKGWATFNNGVPESDISTTTGLIGMDTWLPGDESQNS